MLPRTGGLIALALLAAGCTQSAEQTGSAELLAPPPKFRSSDSSNGATTRPEASQAQLAVPANSSADQKPGETNRVIRRNTGDADFGHTADLPITITVQVPDVPDQIQSPAEPVEPDA